MKITRLPATLSAGFAVLLLLCVYTGQGDAASRTVAPYNPKDDSNYRRPRQRDPRRHGRLSRPWCTHSKPSRLLSDAKGWCHPPLCNYYRILKPLLRRSPPHSPLTRPYTGFLVLSLMTSIDLRFPDGSPRLEFSGGTCCH
jgi:hypothetical protein